MKHPSVCCEQPSLYIYYQLGVSTRDGGVGLKIDKVTCQTCGRAYLFEADDGTLEDELILRMQIEPRVN